MLLDFHTETDYFANFREMLYLMKLFWADSVFIDVFSEESCSQIILAANDGLSTFPIFEESVKTLKL